MGRKVVGKAGAARARRPASATARGVLAAVATVFGLTVSAVLPAAAFVMEGAAGRDDAIAPVFDLDYAPHWQPGGGAFVETGARGLDGGIEVSISDDICRLDFIDGDRPSCAAVKRTVMAAFERWGAGNSSLFFTDVSNKVRPDIPRDPLARLRAGAEIDVLTATDWSLRELRRAAAYSYVHALDDGRGGRRMEAADVVIDREACVYFDAAYERAECFHFGSLMMHEIGHALGLDHNLEAAGRNLAAVPGACDGRARVRPESRLEPLSVMAPVFDGDWRWRLGLSADDVAGRDALYSPCAPRGTSLVMRDPDAPGGAARSLDTGGAGTENRGTADFVRVPRPEGSATPRAAAAGRAAPGEWGAFARGDGQAFGIAVAHDHREAAARALADCRGRSGAAEAGACTVTTWFTQCLAFAKGGHRDEGVARAGRKTVAELGALAQCRRRGDVCAVWESRCTATGAARG